MKQTTEHANKVLEMREMGKREAEIYYKDMLNDKLNIYNKTMKNIKD